MIKAELNYNPYLRKTEIKFNEQKPKVNSLVEKYQHEILQDWISSVPRIFHDEMNGYNFELEFSGTSLDFDELRQSFLHVGVDETQVRLRKKNELEDRKVKEEQMKAFFEWLQIHKNRKFDYEEFQNQNQDLFDDAFTCILVQGGMIDLSEINQIRISVENIESAEEVVNANLSYAPIIFCVNDENINNFQFNLKKIVLREDIHQSQMFFLIQKTSDCNKIERLIKDLGVYSPQIIDQIDDEIVQRYLEVFPLTDYIYRSVLALQKESEKISSMLEKENEASEQSNQEVYKKLEMLDAVLNKLKDAEDKFIQKDCREIPGALQDAKKRLLAAISEWRGRKVKISKDDEAKTAATQFELDASRFYNKYIQCVRTVIEEEQNNIHDFVKIWYDEAEMDLQFVVRDICTKEVSFPTLEPFAAELLKLKEERYVEKSAFFDKFFKANNGEVIESVLEISYAYESWRQYVLQVIGPIAEQIEQDTSNVLTVYYEELAEGYLQHIRELIVKEEEERNKVAKYLSVEEKLLQDDNKWLLKFKEQLKCIERN